MIDRTLRIKAIEDKILIEGILTFMIMLESEKEGGILFKDKFSTEVRTRSVALEINDMAIVFFELKRCRNG